MFNKNVTTKDKLVELPNKFKTSQYKRFKVSKTNEEKTSYNSEEYQPKEKIVRILYKEVGKAPKIKFIDNTLEAKQKLVGGLIEVIPYNDLLLVCNDEGKVLDLPPNVIFDYDYIAGNCFVIGDDYENADFKSLTIEEIVKARKDLIHRSFKYNVQENPRIIDNDHGQIIK